MSLQGLLIEVWAPDFILQEKVLKEEQILQLSFSTSWAPCMGCRSVPAKPKWTQLVWPRNKVRTSGVIASEMTLIYFMTILETFIFSGTMSFITPVEIYW